MAEYGIQLNKPYYWTYETYTAENTIPIIYSYTDGDKLTISFARKGTTTPHYMDINHTIITNQPTNNTILRFENINSPEKVVLYTVGLYSDEDGGSSSITLLPNPFYPTSQQKTQVNQEYNYTIPIENIVPGIYHINSVVKYNWDGGIPYELVRYISSIIIPTTIKTFNMTQLFSNNRVELTIDVHIHGETSSGLFKQSRYYDYARTPYSQNIDYTTLEIIIVFKQNSTVKVVKKSINNNDNLTIEIPDQINPSEPVEMMIGVDLNTGNSFPNEINGYESTYESMLQRNGLNFNPQDRGIIYQYIDKDENGVYSLSTTKKTITIVDENNTTFETPLIRYENLTGTQQIYNRVSISNTENKTVTPVIHRLSVPGHSTYPGIDELVKYNLSGFQASIISKDQNSIDIHYQFDIQFNSFSDYFTYSTSRLTITALTLYNLDGSISTTIPQTVPYISTIQMPISMNTALQCSFTLHISSQYYNTLLTQMILYPVIELQVDEGSYITYSNDLLASASAQYPSNNQSGYIQTTLSSGLSLQLSNTIHILNQGITTKYEWGYCFLSSSYTVNELSTIYTNFNQDFVNSSTTIPNQQIQTVSSTALNITHTFTDIISEPNLIEYNLSSQSFRSMLTDGSYVNFDNYNILLISRIYVTGKTQPFVNLSRNETIASIIKLENTQIYNSSTEAFDITDIAIDFNYQTSPIPVNLIEPVVWLVYLIDNQKTVQANQNALIYRPSTNHGNLPPIFGNHTQMDEQGTLTVSNSSSVNIGSNYYLQLNVNNISFIYHQSKNITITPTVVLYCDSFFTVQQLPSTPYTNLLFTPSLLTVSSILDHPFQRHVNFSYSLHSYVDTIEFNLVSGMDTIQTLIIHPDNSTINLNVEPPTEFQIDLSYASTGYNGSQLSLTYDITNTVGTTDKIKTEQIDVFDELDAFPQLIDVSFNSPTTIRFAFDISKNLFDDVISNNDTQNAYFLLEPFDYQYTFADANQTKEQISSTTYRIFVLYNSISQNHPFIHNTTYHCSVKTSLHAQEYASNQISITYELPSITSISTSFTSSTNILTIHSVALSSLSFPQSTITETDLHYEFVISIPTTSYTITRTITDNELPITIPYNYNSSASIVAHLTYTNVNGTVSSSPHVQSTPVKPNAPKIDSKYDPSSDELTIPLSFTYEGVVSEYYVDIYDTTASSVVVSEQNALTYTPSTDIIDTGGTLTFKQHTLSITLSITNPSILDTLKIRGYVKYGAETSSTTTVPLSIILTDILSVSSFMSSPAFIDISFDIGGINNTWRDSAVDGFIEIYEYISSTSPPSISSIPEASFSLVKTCRLSATDAITGIPHLGANEYLVNTYIENVPIQDGKYYVYELGLGLNNGHTNIIRRDATKRTMVHVNFGVNDYVISVGNTVNGEPIYDEVYLFSTGSTIPILESSVFHPNPLVEGQEFYEFYAFHPEQMTYSLRYQYVNSSVNGTELYTSSSTSSIEPDGYFPNATLLYVTDVSEVELEISMNYVVNAKPSFVLNPSKIFTQSYGLPINPKSIENLDVRKIHRPSDNRVDIHLSWSHQGVVEYFEVVAFNESTQTNVYDVSVVGQYVIGQDTTSTVHNYKYDISYGDEFIDAVISFNITPYFYGGVGQDRSKQISFVFEATDVSFYAIYPVLFDYSYDIGSIEQQQVTTNIAVLVGVSNEDISDPLTIEPRNVFAIFEKVDDPARRLQQHFYPYSVGDTSGVATSYDLLDLSYGFDVSLVAGLYYYFTVSPVVTISGENIGNLISPPSTVIKIQLPDISGVDVSLVFHQAYTQTWTSSNYDAETELERFGIDNSANILEVKYTTWNGWANELVIEVAYNGTEDFSVVDETYRIQNMKHVYRDVETDILFTSPRWEGIELEEVYGRETLLSNGDYYSAPLSYDICGSVPAFLTDFSNNRLTDISNQYYSLSGHYLIRYTDTSNVSVRVRQVVDNFETFQVSSATIPTPVRPTDIDATQFHAKNMWPLDESEVIHIYLQSYNVEELDLSALVFRITAYDVSNDTYLVDTVYGHSLNNYQIGYDTDISFSSNVLEGGVGNVFAFDVSYSRGEETTDIDISLVVEYYGIESNVVDISLYLISSAPTVIESSIPNPTTNPTQDPKQIDISLQFLNEVDMIGLDGIEVEVDICNNQKTGGYVYRPWVNIEPTISGDIAFIEVYNPDEGLAENTWYYFRFRGLYGDTFTSWSSAFEVHLTELVNRPDTEITFVGYNLDEFMNTLDVTTIPKPFNILTVSFEDVSYVSSYQIAYHHTTYSHITNRLVYKVNYSTDYVVELDITPRYDNIVVEPFTISNETLVVPVIQDAQVSSDNLVLIEWTPLSFSSGYNILRSVLRSPELLPSDVSMQIIATTNNPDNKKYLDIHIRDNQGNILRFNPVVYYGVSANYDISGVVKTSYVSPLVYLLFNIGCVCPLPGQVLNYNSSQVVRQISNRQRIGRKLMNSRMYN